MAGYRAAEMIETPWGNAGKLRAGQLPAGRGTPREEAVRNQRERIFGALVATVATQGYEATRVADLVELSGVSRSAFYKHFRDKEACFLAAVEALIGSTMDVVTGASLNLSEEERARQAFATFVELIVAQPAAARMCFVEIYAAGPEAVRVVDQALERFEGFVRQRLEGIPGRAGMPPALVRAMIGGLRKAIHGRLYRGTEGELRALAPELMDWALSYETPPEPLRRPRRRLPPASHANGFHDVAERLLRGLAETVAEKGYPETTVADVVARAQTSQRTFYEHFANKEEALLAALDWGSSQMLARILPAYRRAPDWPTSIRAALEAMLAFGAAEPQYTQLGAVDIYASGIRALEQRDKVMAGLEGMLAPGFEQVPGTPSIVGEAIGGAVYALVYDQVRAKGAATLPELGPIATYVALAPFLGPQRACELANGDDRRR